MRPLESPDTTPKAGSSAMRRFLPYLWPEGEPGLKARVVIAFLLVLLAKGVSLPVSEKVAKTVLSLPINPTLDEASLDRICAVIRKA